MRAVNLIPADQRRGAGGFAGRSGGVMYVVVGGLVVVVGMGVLYAFSVKTVADRQGSLADVTNQVTAVQAQAAALTPYVEVQQLRDQAVAAVVGLAEQRFDWPDAMRQIALALPTDVTLSALTGNAAGATTAAAVGTTTTTGGASFSMSGCASSQSEVATVLTQLAHVPGVTGVQLSNAGKTSDKAPNSGPQVARSKDSAPNGQCPLVAFTLTLSYDPTYTVPNSKISGSSATSAQTVSTSSTSATGATGATQPSN